MFVTYDYALAYPICFWIPSLAHPKVFASRNDVVVELKIFVSVTCPYAGDYCIVNKTITHCVAFAGNASSAIPKDGTGMATMEYAMVHYEAVPVANGGTIDIECIRVAYEQALGNENVIDFVAHAFQ
jgi:hypothetical protein